MMSAMTSLPDECRGSFCGEIKNIIVLVGARFGGASVKKTGFSIYTKQHLWDGKILNRLSGRRIFCSKVVNAGFLYEQTYVIKTLLFKFTKLLSFTSVVIKCALKNKVP